MHIEQTLPKTREQLQEAAKKESARKDMKQHADKLIKGFEELNETTAQRGVWELTQNAGDLTANCHITLDFRNKQFAFSHNGEAFTVDTLLSLIKQVSSKSSTGEETVEEGRKQIGRFGTGFITTHAYGRNLMVSGALQIADGQYVQLRDFHLNREAEVAEDLLLSIEKQQEDVFAMVWEADIISQAEPLTTLRYIPKTDTEREHIEQAFKSVKLSLPLVMALNEVLKEATVIDEEGNVITYRKGEAQEWDGMWQIPIEANGSTQLIHCLCPPYSELQVVVPLTEEKEACEWPADLARLFLYFPLIGSERWGCSFLTHSSSFAPTNERNGLHLTFKNDQIRAKSTLNRQELHRASGLVFEFLERMADQVREPLRLARVRFDAIAELEEEDFRKELQKEWVGKFKDLKLVETQAGRLTPAECWFLKEELLLDDEALPAIQAVAEQLWDMKLPEARLAKDWAAVLLEWHDDSIQRIGSEELAKAIAKRGEMSDFDPATLQIVYKYWLEHQQGPLFDKHTLLPNRRNKLKSKEILKRAQNLEPRFLEVLELVLPDKLGELVGEDFELDLGLTPYQRNELVGNVTEYGRKLIEQGTAKVPVGLREGLLQLCSIFPSEATNVINSLRWKLLPFLCSFYGKECERVIIANVSDDEVRYDEMPLRLLIRLFLLDFQAKYDKDNAWKATALPELQECLELLSNNSEMRKEILLTAAVFPNQLSELKQAAQLKIEMDFSPSNKNVSANAEQLKEWYREGMGWDCRKDLAHPDFVDIVKRMERPVEEGSELAGRLDLKLSETRLEDIANHPKNRLIIDIIQKMTTEKGWEDYFSRINIKKAEIMLAKIADPTMKDNLFGIISLNKDKIAQLGELARSANLGELLAQAQLLMQKAREKASDFAFKKMIGVGIEDLIRSHVEQQVQGLKVVVLEQQNGQDIVVMLNENIVYRIEVKSRWQSKYSVTMSYRQLSEAVTHPNRYALCSVDLVDYWPEQADKRHDIKDIGEIRERIRFVTNIGHQILPLVKEVKAAEGNEDAVRLADEYRVVIPQGSIKAGIGFDDFIMYFTAKIIQ
jgi:hypothetical protein